MRCIRDPLHDPSRVDQMVFLPAGGPRKGLAVKMRRVKYGEYLKRLPKSYEYSFFQGVQDYEGSSGSLAVYSVAVSVVLSAARC